MTDRERLGQIEPDKAVHPQSQPGPTPDDELSRASFSALGMAEAVVYDTLMDDAGEAEDADTFDLARRIVADLIESGAHIFPPVRVRRVNVPRSAITGRFNPRPIPPGKTACERCLRLGCRGECATVFSPGGAVDPEWIKAQREAGWPDMHPEDYCHRCGERNPNWWTDADTWLTATATWAAETGREGICCPRCLIAMHEAATGHPVQWQLVRVFPPAERHELTGTACSCGNWEAALGESIHRGFDRHLLEVRDG